MHDRDNISDEIPIADAVEQEQETTPVSASPEEADPPVEPPMEADPPDWHEQWQEVGDTDADDRDEYRE
ncbi:MAG: hypothetical protein ACRDUT_16890 [Mycobacterium sp.]